jgi:hypothetical protein
VLEFDGGLGGEAILLVWVQPPSKNFEAGLDLVVFEFRKAFEEE